MDTDINGINIGSENSIISTYKKGNFEILIDKLSSRKIPTVVSFNDHEKNYGEFSLQTNISNYKRTIISPNRWLGFQKNWDFILKEKEYSFIEPTAEEEGKIGFKINYKNKEEIFYPENLMGFFFYKLKNIWLNSNIKTKNVVVSIPDYCIAHERQAMKDAITIGGLQCSAIINESSSITFDYFFEKMKYLENNEKRIVSFIDFGNASCNIIFSQFTNKTAKVLSVTSERFCEQGNLIF